MQRKFDSNLASGMGNNFNSTMMITARGGRSGSVDEIGGGLTTLASQVAELKLRQSNNNIPNNRNQQKQAQSKALPTSSSVIRSINKTIYNT